MNAFAFTTPTELTSFFPRQERSKSELSLSIMLSTNNAALRVSVKGEAMVLGLAHGIVTSIQRRPYVNSPPLPTPGIVVSEELFHGSVVFAKP